MLEDQGLNTPDPTGGRGENGAIWQEVEGVEAKVGEQEIKSAV